jgi:PAS domain S-box-containing protein
MPHFTEESTPLLAQPLAALVVGIKAPEAGGFPGNRLEQEHSSRGLTPLVKAWGAAVLLQGLAISTGLVSYRTALFVNDLVWTAASIFAGVSSFRAAKESAGAERAAWMIFMLACATWAGGQIVWDVLELYLGIRLPFPSYADFGYLAYGPLMIVGLFVLRATQQERGLTWLRTANLGLILCSLALVLITTFMQPFAKTQRPLNVSLIVVAENASITVAFIIATYFLWSYRWGNRLLAYSLLTLSLGTQMICGLMYTRELIADEYGAFSIFNIGWTVAFGLHQLAAEAEANADVRMSDNSPLLRQGHGLVEALVPSFLLICVAITAAVLAEEITAQTLHLGTLVLVAFAAVLATREAWLYLRGQQLRSALDSSVSALARSRERLDAVNAQRSELERQIEVTARAGGVGLWEWDLVTNTVRYSREWKRQLGYSEDEIGDDFTEWRQRLHPDDEPRVNAALEEFLAHPEGEYISEQRLQHRDGSYRWILAQGCVVLDSAGHAARMLGSHVDITAFKRMEESLRESEGRYRGLVDALESRVTQRTRELMEAYRESQNFAYAVAHDLKAPLRAISGFCTLLEQSASERLNEQERNYIHRATQGALRMAALIDALLQYSRIEHREQRLVAIDCRQFVESLLADMSYVIERVGAEVVVNLGRTPVMADKEGLRIALSNLLDNALKFSRTNKHPRIVIESYSEPGRYIIRIRDNGIGFNPAYRDKIFEIFNRLHATGYEGTGIGLALVRKAVQRMNGEVWADSVPGEGATFYVCLRSRAAS